MRINKTRAILKKTVKNDNGYANITPQERISFMWEIAAEIWSLRKRNKKNVERRLQRHIANLVKKQG
jgi:hypothetical protein